MEEFETLNFMVPLSDEMVSEVLLFSVMCVVIYVECGKEAAKFLSPDSKKSTFF